jgi:hypothetical protein
MTRASHRALGAFTLALGVLTLIFAGCERPVDGVADALPPTGDAAPATTPAGTSADAPATIASETSGGSSAERERPDPQAVPSNQAILAVGPVRGRGIRFLGPNVIEHQRAEYRVREGTIVVLYFEYQGELWEESDSYLCGSNRVAEVETFDGTVDLYSAPDWRCFVVFPDSFEARCAFLSPFVDRLRFFKSASRDDPVVPFPAFIELEP